jgi:hypothetical protein
MIIGVIMLRVSWSCCKCNHSQFSSNIPIYLTHGVSGSGINSFFISRRFSGFYRLLISIFQFRRHLVCLCKYNYWTIAGIQHVFPVSFFPRFLSWTDFDFPSQRSSGFVLQIDWLWYTLHSIYFPYFAVSHIFIFNWFRSSSSWRTWPVSGNIVIGKLRAFSTFSLFRPFSDFYLVPISIFQLRKHLGAFSTYNEWSDLSDEIWLRYVVDQQISDSWSDPFSCLSQQIRNWCVISEINLI